MSDSRYMKSGCGITVLKYYLKTLSNKEKQRMKFQKRSNSV